MNTEYTNTPFNGDEFDVVVIGAGVVGCAVARRLCLKGAKVLVVDKAKDILDGASKGNSAILHTGFDAPADSLELTCMQEGYGEYMKIRASLNLPLLECSAIVAAWNDADEARLPEVLAQAHANEVTDARMLSSAEIRSREPALSAQVRGGVLVPGEHIIDPWTAPYAYLSNAIDNGAMLSLSTEVRSGDYHSEGWMLHTNCGSIRCKTVVNCAGLYGDLVDSMLLGSPSFTIRPRKGQFVVFDKSASRLLKAILLPVPSERTKGIVLCRTVFGNLLVGPTAEEQESRTDASVDTATLNLLRQRAIELIPALASESITATYSGLRPATQFKHYCIQMNAEKAYITVGGIRSTGLTASLGIANYVGKLIDDLIGQQKLTIASPPDDPVVRPVEYSLAEHELRDWQQPDNQGIVCHCELVTRREIETAITGANPVHSLQGLKRRTRAGMGRCQGFYCSAAIHELTRLIFKELKINAPAAEDQGNDA